MLQRALKALKARHPSLALPGKEPMHPASLSPKELLPAFNPVVSDLEPAQVSAHTLPNGIPVVIESSSSLPLCSLVVSSSFGTRHLASADSALLFALQTLAFRSGSPDSESRILSGLEVLGGSTHFAYTPDSCHYHLSCFKHHFPAALQALCVCLTAERQGKDELVARSRMAEYWKVRAEVGTIAERVKEIWLKESFGLTLGREINGTVGDVAEVTNDRINRLIKRVWSRENITLGFSGPADPLKVMELLTSSFTSMPSSPQLPQSTPRFQCSRYLEDLDCSRAHGILSYPSVSVSNPLFPAFLLLVEAIGRDYLPQSRLSSDIKRAVKGELGEIEKFRAISGHYRDVGVIGVEFTAESSGKWTNTVQIAQKVINFVRKIDSTALETLKKALKLRITQHLSAPEQRLQHFVRSQALLGTVQSQEEELRLVDRVDLNTIQQVCEEMLGGEGALVMLGPAVSQLARPSQ